MLFRIVQVPQVSFSRQSLLLLLKPFFFNCFVLMRSVEAVQKYQVQGRTDLWSCTFGSGVCGCSAANRCWKKQGHEENWGQERDRHKESRVDNPPADRPDTEIPSRQWIIQGSLCVWPPDTRTSLLLVETFDLHTQQLFTGAYLVSDFIVVHVLCWLTNAHDLFTAFLNLRIYWIFFSLGLTSVPPAGENKLIAADKF